MSLEPAWDIEFQASLCCRQRQSLTNQPSEQNNMNSEKNIRQHKNNFTILEIINCISLCDFYFLPKTEYVDLTSPLQELELI